MNYLKEAEMTMLDPVQTAAAPAVVQRLEFSASAAAHAQLDERLQSSLPDESAPVVKSRAGAHFQSLFFDFDEGHCQSHPVVQSEASCQAWPHPTSAPPLYAQLKTHSHCPWSKTLLRPAQHRIT